MSLSLSPRRASTRLRRAGPVYNHPSMRELRGLGHAVGSRDPPSFSPARIVRGGGRARARAPLREITAGTPLIPGRRRRRRETALTPLRSSSSFISDDAHGDARRRASPPPPSSSWIGSSTISRGFGGPRLARAHHGRTSNDRSYARARYGGAQAVFGYLNDPQPGVVRELYPWTAMCVRNVDVHVSCSSQVDAQLAAFFIDPRAK